MKESLVKYLAGLLDADGSLSLSFKRDNNRPDRYFVGLMLSLSSSDKVDRKGFVLTLPAQTGMGAVSRYGDRSQYTQWRVTRRADLEMMLPRLIKHMVIKAKHWQFLLDSWRDLRRTSVSGREMDALRAAGKESRRLRDGPLKPKKHPTWAWLAGYLDGDGWYSRRYCKSPQNYWAMRVGAVAHVNDAAVLRFLQESFGGSIKPHGQSESCEIWYRSLGVRDASFALRFLPNLAKHSRLKRHKIDQMIHHHRQRLSDSAPAGEATV